MQFGATHTPRSQPNCPLASGFRQGLRGPAGGVRTSIMWLSADRTMKGLKGGGIAMKTSEIKSASRPVQDSRNDCGHDRLPPRVHPSGWINFLRTKKHTHLLIAGCGSWRDAFEAENWGCGQCPHFRLRTGSYWGRIGPDSVCFRGSPVFARAGMRFESHLGHVFSLFRGL
jgi:hypothetical protein